MMVTLFKLNQTGLNFKNKTMLTQEIVNIKSNALFKLLIIGYAGIFVPISIISAILSLFEIVPTILNKIEYYGIKGFVIAIITTPIYIFLMAGASWLFLIIGLRFSKIALKLFHRN